MEQVPPESLAKAMALWQQRLGADRVLDASAAMIRYGASTSGKEVALAGAIIASSVEDVIEVVRIAAALRVPLYSISTGNNWGYNTAQPDQPNCVLLDLSGLRAIRDYDPVLATVTIEPGVTQGDLDHFLKAHGDAFMVPTTGAGPQCSIVGNALERGYGITPIADHFAAVLRMEVVLPDGSLWQSPLSAAGGERADRVFKWGIGPYVDGLFSQGSFGIVVSMSIALARRPPAFSGFYFSINNEDGLVQLVEAVRSVLQQMPGVCGSINLMNQRRVLAMTAPYPATELNASGIVSQAAIERLGRHHRLTAWTGIGGLYGEPEVVAAAQAVVKRLLKPACDRLLFMNHRKVGTLWRIISLLPRGPRTRLQSVLTAVRQSLDIMTGRPSTVALALPYWKGNAVAADPNPNPAKDGCGLIWYPPLVPMTGADVMAYVEHIESVCTRHRIEPMITLTAISDRCFDSSIPILFDRRSAQDVANAHACYQALLSEGSAKGFVPYRLFGEALKDMAGSPTVHWRLVSLLKDAVDPHHILSPGRYARQTRQALRDSPEGLA